MEKSASFSKGKVELIKIIPYSKNLLVIHEGSLYYVDGMTLEKELIAKKHVVIVELNKDP